MEGSKINVSLVLNKKEMLMQSEVLDCCLSCHGNHIHIPVFLVAMAILASHTAACFPVMNTAP